MKKKEEDLKDVIYSAVASVTKKWRAEKRKSNKLRAALYDLEGRLSSEGVYLDENFKPIED